MKYLIILILFIVSLFTPVKCVLNHIEFEQQCAGFLKQAADANTIKTAILPLHNAVNYLEENNITSGYTSIIYKTPDEDISFWYNNLKSSLEELRSTPKDITRLEESNMLLKLRETLLDETQYGTKVTIPDGISRYPHNGLYFALNSISIFLLIWLLLPIIRHIDG